MNKENAKYYLPFVRALAEGKAIQFLPMSLDRWVEVDSVTDAYPPDRYRIKPEPKEIWMNRYPNGTNAGPYDSEQDAHCRRSNDTAIQVCYREVIE